MFLNLVPLAFFIASLGCVGYASYSLHAWSPLWNRSPVRDNAAARMHLMPDSPGLSMGERPGRKRRLLPRGDAAHDRREHCKSEKREERGSRSEG